LGYSANDFPLHVHGFRRAAPPCYCWRVQELFQLCILALDIGEVASSDSSPRRKERRLGCIPSDCVQFFTACLSHQQNRAIRRQPSPRHESQDSGSALNAFKTSHSLSILAGNIQAIALVDATGDLLSVFDSWMRWHAHRAQGKSQHRNSHYYRSNVFACDILAFVGEAIDSGCLPDTQSLRNVLEYEEALCDLEPAPTVEAPPTGIQRASLKSRVRKAEGVVIRSFTFDLPGLLDSLRSGKQLCETDNRSCCTAIVARRGRPIQVLQLSEDAAQLLLLCNIENTIDHVVDKYCDAHVGRNNRAMRKKAGFAGLKRLYEDGLLEIRPPT
jgi:hypothetical protein